MNIPADTRKVLPVASSDQMFRERHPPLYIPRETPIFQATVSQKPAESRTGPFYNPDYCMGRPGRNTIGWG